MRRTAILIYGIFAYGTFVAAILYLVGFLGNVVVPKSIDAPPGAASGNLAQDLAVDLLLILAFSVQHSGMARRQYKKWVTRFVPHSAERSTYVLATSIVFGLLFWFWRPIPDTVWQVESDVLEHVLVGLFWLGWLIALVSTFAINHFDLFGMRQVVLASRRQPYEPLEFTETGPYRYVRHPINLGFLIAVWAAPHMTFGHLIFSIALTVYILAATRLEERDLVAAHGERYRRYRERVRMLVPGRRSS